MVPNDTDWIQIMDYDAMILSTNTYQVIENALTNPHNAHIQVFGAMTNRIGRTLQRLLPEPDTNDSIAHHIKIAERLAEQYPNGETHPSLMAAGFFLLFRKSYWKQNPFQEKIISDKGQLFDHAFTKPAAKQQAIGIIKGAYLWHTYRLTHKDIYSKEHLGINEMVV
jgi:hypothetical protein